MKNIIIIIVVILLFLGCTEQEEQKKDIVLESVAEFEEIFNSPLNQGRKVFGKYCSVCHGITGQGDGFNAYNLDPKPRNFLDSSFIARIDTSLVIETISNGGKAVGLSSKMPPWGHTLSADNIKNVANFVISFSQNQASQ